MSNSTCLMPPPQNHYFPVRLRSLCKPLKPLWCKSYVNRQCASSSRGSHINFTVFLFLCRCCANGPFCWNKRYGSPPWGQEGRINYWKFWLSFDCTSPLCLYVSNKPYLVKYWKSCLHDSSTEIEIILLNISTKMSPINPFN